MNRLHHWYCARPGWSRYVREELVPGTIADTDLGQDVLEVGPGPGRTTDVLAPLVDRLTVLEIDAAFAQPLEVRFAGTSVEVRQGDASRMPFADDSFSAVVCFTMLHHVPTSQLQDRIFAEARRVLRPGGSFIGSDSVGRSLGFRFLHVRDTKTVLNPSTLPDRLHSAGFEKADVRVDPPIRFRAT